MPKYQGKTVTSSRPAREGDPKYDAKLDQVVIQVDDGKPQTVLRTEVTE